MRRRIPRTIAPRLANGEKRESIGHGLPPNIKQALRMKAVAQNRSLSWILEQDLIRLYRFERPEYVERKAKLKLRKTG